MSKIKYLFGFLFAISISGCTDWVEPAIPYNEFETGVYLRTLAQPGNNFNFFDLDNAFFEVTVEAVDAEDGRLVQEVDVFVARRRGPSLTAEAKLFTVPASAFAPQSSSKYLATTIRVTAPEALAALGLTKADVNGGDFFEFRLSLLDVNGRVFTNSNLSGDVSGGQFYRSPFFYRIPVVCPSNLGGTYEYETTNVAAGPGGNAGACGASVTGTVTFTAVANTVGVYTLSDPSFGVFACAWSDTPPGGSVRFNDACGAISFSGSDKYGDSYSLTFISNDGENLVIEWTNTYGDGGTTTIKANPGKPWPPTLK